MRFNQDIFFLVTVPLVPSFCQQRCFLLADFVSTCWERPNFSLFECPFTGPLVVDCFYLFCGPSRSVRKRSFPLYPDSPLLSTFQKQLCRVVRHSFSSENWILRSKSLDGPFLLVYHSSSSLLLILFLLQLL